MDRTVFVMCMGIMLWGMMPEEMLHAEEGDIQSNWPHECGVPSTIIKPQGASRNWILSTNISMEPSSVTYFFASTSGTSGCEGWFAKRLRQIEQEEYLFQTWSELAEETSRGGGPHLNGLAGLMGCSDVSHPMFVNTMRRDFQSMFAKKPTEIATLRQMRIRITTLIELHPDLLSACSING